MGTQDSTIWIHDEKGEHEISQEGNSSNGTFSQDEKRLFYLKSSGGEAETELWSTELAGGKSERVVPGYEIAGGFDTKNYAIAGDGKRVAFAKKDEKGIAHLWVASTDHRSAPEQLESSENEDSPSFLPNGDLIYRGTEVGKNYRYTRKQDGSGKKRLLETTVLDVLTTSPDGRWTVVTQRDDQDREHPYQTTAYANAGSGRLVICRTMCFVSWSVDGKYMQVQFEPDREAASHLLTVRKETGLPELPANGLGGPEHLKPSPKQEGMPESIESSFGPDQYAYTRTNIRRNIYRVPIP